MKKTAKYITEQDMFGHTVNLNFDRRGDSHQTTCGGVFSIALRTFLVLYVYLLVDKLIYKGNDTDFSYYGLQEMDELGVVDYKDMNMKIFHVISKQDSTSTPKITKLSDIDPYFKITFDQNDIDYNLPKA